uniref:Uncharacterized protein n=1 Tax=Avena sativa TaxID=4498 RepID=A0ACD5W7W2_AVESA
MMGAKDAPTFRAILCSLLLLLLSRECMAAELNQVQAALLQVNTSWEAASKIPQILFGLFFEEINHAGAGGIWAELVSNRGFEAGGPNASNIDPRKIIGDESSIYVKTERASCFSKNIIALRMEVLCDECPAGSVGIYNPGFWGMNIEEGKAYNLVMYIRSMEPVELTVSLKSSDGLQNMASADIVDNNVSYWRKIQLQFVAKGTCITSRFELTTFKRGVIWIDQVSLMPSDTYKGHGFRKELIHMLVDLRPQFLRFPGGCFVEGISLRNAFRWKETVGPWEESPGHYGDVWNYWTDDGLGYYEFLQLAEDLGAEPIWVFNAGISHNDEVNGTALTPFVKDALDSIQFARGSAESAWGSVRAANGHPEKFPLKYVAVGNEDCVNSVYHGNYMQFYKAIREAYPDIQIISNCDGSTKPLDHPADLYDFHVYKKADLIFQMKDKFSNISRTGGPKAFVSEYAVNNDAGDAGSGSLLASLAEAAFLIGLEQNSDIVHMASYAPLFVIANDRRWIPDAIVFNSWKQYGTPSYWMQTFFRESSGAVIHPVRLASSYSDSLAASAITWKDDEHMFLRIKIVPVSSGLQSAAEKMEALLLPYSFTGFDLALH